MADGALVSRDELADHLQRAVGFTTAESAIRVAEGWLASATRIVDWPFPVPADLFSWAVELAGLVYDNPTALSSRTIGSEAEAWVVARRAEILAAAARRYGRTGAPVYSFPLSEPYPGMAPQVYRS